MNRRPFRASRPLAFLALCAFFSLLSVASLSGCPGSPFQAAPEASIIEPPLGFADSSADHGSDGDDGGSAAQDASGDATTADACVGLACDVHLCDGTQTTIRGRVFDPAGKNPIFGATVYVPVALPLPALLSGASCASCASLYAPAVTSSVTDAFGNFELQAAPDGPSVPVVVQLGKWRRTFMVNVPQCQPTALPDHMLNLPANGTQGDMPNIAVSIGVADSLECLLLRAGISASEFVPGPWPEGGAPDGGVPEAGTGHVNVFQGYLGSGGANTTPPGPASRIGLWDSVTHLQPYDLVLLGCDGDLPEGMNQQAMHDYLSAGGRVLAEHYHYGWFNTGPFASENIATWEGNGGDDLGNVNLYIETTLPNGHGFTKGIAYSQWLQGVHALSGTWLPSVGARADALVSGANTPSQEWLGTRVPVADGGSIAYSEQFTFNTPTNAPPPDQCGRVAWTGLHVTGAVAPLDYGGAGHAGSTPSQCTMADLSPQENAIEFVLFDLTGCVVPDK
jgi:hypothetical protein